MRNARGTRTPARAAAGQRRLSLAVAGRLSWGLADQAVSSLTNFAVGIFVARSLGAVAFGVFTLAWVTFGVVLNVSRGLATDPLVVRFSGVPVEDWRRAAARSAGTAMCIGFLTGAICLLVATAASAVAGPSVTGAFLALSMVLPGLLLQDGWRFAFFASGQGGKAFTNDVVWGIALVPALLLAAQQGTVFAFVLAWGVSGAVAAGCGCLQTRLLPLLPKTPRWLREHRDLGTRYLIENVTNSGAGQLRMYGIGAIAGFADVGAIRGAELLVGPFLAVLMGLSMVAVPEASRVLRTAPSRLRPFCAVLSGGQAAAALTWGLAVLLLLPEAAGNAVLGDVWEPASALLLPITLSVTCAGVVAGAAAGLRALGAARLSLRAQLIASSAYLSAGLAGAAIAGAFGAAWGSALAMCFGAAVWWLYLNAGCRDLERTPEPEKPEHADYQEMRTG